jgi:hypothetical protein
MNGHNERSKRILEAAKMLAEEVPLLIFDFLEGIDGDRQREADEARYMPLEQQSVELFEALLSLTHKQELDKQAAQTGNPWRPKINKPYEDNLG